MINILNVYKALKEQLENVTNISVTSKDIQEGFDRPCLYIDIGKMENDKVGLMEHETIPFVIYYFGEKREKGYVELLKKKVELQSILSKPIVIDDTFILEAEDVEYDIDRSDMWISASFTFEMIQENDNEVETCEAMQNIEINIEEE